MADFESFQFHESPEEELQLEEIQLEEIKLPLSDNEIIEEFGLTDQSEQNKKVFLRIFKQGKAQDICAHLLHLREEKAKESQDLKMPVEETQVPKVRRRRNSQSTDHQNPSDPKYTGVIFDDYLTPQKKLEKERTPVPGHAECPFCKSYNTEKVGTLSRAFSIGMLGFASKKIGAQWHCCSCDSYF